MSKYRIIKSLAMDEDEPYFLQYWNEGHLTWMPVEGYQGNYSVYAHPLQYKTLKEAKKEIEKRKATEELKATSSEVVWEDEDAA